MALHPWRQGEEGIPAIRMAENRLAGWQGHGEDNRELLLRRIRNEGMFPFNPGPFTRPVGAKHPWSLVGIKHEGAVNCPVGRNAHRVNGTKVPGANHERKIVVHHGPSFLSHNLGAD
jgi:hypothetical protein